MAEVVRSQESADNFVDRIAAFARRDPEFWTFRSSTKRLGRHGICTYPAMMVPEMQGLLIEEWCREFGTKRLVRDPFVGAGTTLVESAARGLRFHGVDINPLAVLICEAKLVHRSASVFHSALRRIGSRLRSDHKNTFEADFFGRDKWCTRALCIALSRIRRTIDQEADAGIRKVAWTVVADVARKFSNSRSETFKLHARLEPRTETTSEITGWFLVRLDNVFRILAANVGTDMNEYVNKRVTLDCADARSMSTLTDDKASLIISSPPYGDNHTTVPYGQFSYISLNWICERDLRGTPTSFSNTRAIDSASLGGSARRRGSHERLFEVSPSYRRTLRALGKTGAGTKVQKVASFFGELFETFDAVHASVGKGAVSIWTIGDRSVGGLKVPLAAVIAECGTAIGARRIDTITREIPSKRTPSRNSSGHTINREKVVVCLF